MLKDAMGGYRGTESEITRILAEHPDYAEAWYNRGNDRSSCGDYTGAEHDYTRALQLGLRFREAINAYGNRALARVKIGDVAGAMEDFNEIIVRQPKNRWMLRTAYVNRALLKEQQGDDAGAHLDKQAAERIKK